MAIVRLAEYNNLYNQVIAQQGFIRGLDLSIRDLKTHVRYPPEPEPPEPEPEPILVPEPEPESEPEINTILY